MRLTTSSPFVRLVAFALAVAAPVAAQWTQITPSLNPPARSNAAAAFDVHRGVTVLFGGYDGTIMPRGDTWEWNGTAWAPSVPAVRPAPRWGHCMAFDVRRRCVVLFGGFDGWSLRDDTWEWDGLIWLPRTLAVRPPARAFASMAYDGARGVCVLFGGQDAAQAGRDDTWEYDGFAWTQRTPATLPAARYRAAMAWDETRRETLLFGGGDGATVRGDLWAWNGTAWSQRTFASGPSPRWDAALAFDGNCGRAVLVGGSDATWAVSQADSWSWDGLAWSQVSTTSPTARHAASVVHDAQRGRFVLFGGRLGTGAFSQGTWDLAPLCSRTMTTVSPAVVGQTAQFRYDYPGSAANLHFCWTLVTLRQPAALAVPIPGLSVIGKCRVDLLNVLSDTAQLLNGSGATTAVLPIPANTALGGLQFDVQSVDLDLFTLALRWAEDDIETAVGNPAPIASFAAAPMMGYPPLAVGLFNYSQNATNYQWDFGDGTSSVLENPPYHTYNFAGQYTVTLTAFGPGGIDTASYGIVVMDPPLPVASFTAAPLQGQAPLTTTFTDTSVNGPTSWQWDFNGDGVTDALGPSASWTFSSVGAHPVRLTVANPFGVASTTNYVVVLAPSGGLWTESFQSGAFQDSVVSGDQWAGGIVLASPLGDDGRHGSFDLEFGTPLGSGVFEWNLDQVGGIVIPGTNTPSGNAFNVTDGRFFFTDFVLAEGQTLRFRGSVPPQIRVRGRIEIRGTLDLSGVDMPATVPTTGALAGQRVTTFNARGTNVVVTGQAGGLGGCGGGSGGNGANECNGLGPQIVNGVNLTNGQPGQIVRVLGTHAYAGSTAGTGGSGSLLNPATGLSSTIAVGPYIVGATTLTFHDEFSRGGGGGGYILAGGTPALPTIPPPATTQPNSGPVTAGGVAFPLLPFPTTPPANYQSIDHYLVGGSGGGGGGSHSFGILTVLTDDFMAGHGGSGGGGAIALRCGGDLLVASTGQILVRGGRGVVINGDNLSTTTADVDFGVSSPGGGGSGGSILLQAGKNLTVQGLLDARGGAGSRVSNVSVFSTAPTQLSVVAQAGAGSNGFYMLEAGGTLTFNGPIATVPTYDPATNSGPLTDRDDRSGSRSVWVPVTALTPPVWLRYELDVDPDGAGPLTTVTYTDSGAAGTALADDPNGPILAKFQVARRDQITGTILSSSIGSWRSMLRAGASSVNLDLGTDVRFDLISNRIAFPLATVKEVRLYWQ